MLSKEAIAEYQAIYRETYGKEISYEQAVEGGTKLLRLLRLVYVPIPKNWKEKQKKGL